MRLKSGRGYVSADRNFDEDLPLGYIPIDSIHSPVRKVNYALEAARGKDDHAGQARHATRQGDGAEQGMLELVGSELVKLYRPVKSTGTSQPGNLGIQSHNLRDRPSADVRRWAHVHDVSNMSSAAKGGRRDRPNANCSTHEAA